MFTRRIFLETLGRGALTLGVLPSALRASGYLDSDQGTEGGLLIISVHGGMDTTLGTDPWPWPVVERPAEGDLFLEEDYEVIMGAGGTELNLGPSAHGLLPHVGDISFINGVFMGPSDLGHISMRHYMDTATSSPNTPDFLALAAGHRAQREGQRQRVLFNRNIETRGILGLITRRTDTLKGSGPGGRKQHSSREKTLLAAGRFSQGSGPFAHALRALGAPDTGRRALDERIGEIRRQVGAMEPEHLAVAAMAEGWGHFARIDWNNFTDLDSHTGFRDRHRRAQRGVWDRVASLISLMKETPYKDTDIPLFPDRVTLMVTNDFSRPPFLNLRQGKDHNSFDNSVLLAGRGIRGGIVLGGHHLFVRDENRAESQLSGHHIDYDTGEGVKNNYYNTANSANSEDIPEDGTVSLIRPANCLKTVGALFGCENEFSRYDRILPRILS